MSGLARNDVASAAFTRDIANAHGAVVQDRAIQFDLVRVQPEPAAKSNSAFTQALKKFFNQIADWLFGADAVNGATAEILMWGLVALVAAGLLLWLTPKLLRRWRNRQPRASVDEHWQPDAERMADFLEQADALAKAGRYSEAARYLLWRSVEDIERVRPGFVRPASTARDIACSPQLPDLARRAFAAIAYVVEISAFAGNEVSREAWGNCREEYATLSLAGASPQPRSRKRRGL